MYEKNKRQKYNENHELKNIISEVEDNLQKYVVNIMRGRDTETMSKKKRIILRAFFLPSEKRVDR